MEKDCPQIDNALFRKTTFTLTWINISPITSASLCYMILLTALHTPSGHSLRLPDPPTYAFRNFFHSSGGINRWKNRPIHGVLPFVCRSRNKRDSLLSPSVPLGK